MAFAVGLHVTGLVQVTTAATAVARSALSALGDDSLDDDARERAARRASGRLFAATAAILLRVAACLALSAVPVGLADATGLAQWSDVNAFLVSGAGLLTTLVVGAVASLALHRL